MKTSYHERDYAYGAVMLTLRTAIGLTQKGLANLLGVSRRAVGDWEAGSSYPTTEHLKKMIALAVKQQAFPSGHEAQEIRAFVYGRAAAHQRVRRCLAPVQLQRAEHRVGIGLAIPPGNHGIAAGDAWTASARGFLALRSSQESS